VTATAPTRPGLIEEYRGHRLSNGDEPAAHVVDQRVDQDVAAAYVEGRELVALCGYRWVPTRDPHSLPLCRACVAVVEQLIGGAQ
jgi:hypothetical protein